MPGIAGDFDKFDPQEAAEIVARTDRRAAANHAMCEALAPLVHQYERSAAHSDGPSMKATILAIGRLTEPPAHAPLLRQLCMLLSDELHEGIGAERSRYLSELLRAEVRRLQQGEPFASSALVAEARAFRAKVQEMER
jgi:hypothetical protein